MPKDFVVDGEALQLLASIDLPPYKESAGGNDAALGPGQPMNYRFLEEFLGPDADWLSTGFATRPPARNQFALQSTPFVQWRHANGAGPKADPIYCER